MRRTILLAALVLVLGACAQDDPCAEGAWSDPTTIPYAASLGIDLKQMTRTQSGLYYQDVTEGDGIMATVDDSVRVHYTGWFPDGKQFDTSRQGSGQPLEFKVGSGYVIPGMEEGVVGMREGGVRKLVIPPELAYGACGYDIIPPHATLVFQLELLDVLRPQ